MTADQPPNYGVALAEAFRSWFESDHFWQEVARQHRRTGLLLKFRGQLQELARRHRGDPSKFLGGILTAKGKVSRKKQEAFVAIVELMNSAMKSGPIPEEHSHQARRAFLALIAGDPGRPHIALYDEALVLRKKGKTVHQICQRLLSGYRDLPPSRQKTVRQRMDKGIKRAAERLSAVPTG